MARPRPASRHTHAVPHVRPSSLPPRVAGLARPRRPLRPLLAGLLLVATAAQIGGCGRSGFDFLDDVAQQGDVEVSRELTLDDDNIVLVELVSPAPEQSRLARFELEDGVDINAVVDAVTETDSPELFLDATSSIPVIEVWEQGELRALIWQ